MILLKTAWHYKLYMYVYNEKPNQNFCDYFWKLLGAIITTPLWIVPLLLTYLYSKYEKQQVWNYDSEAPRFLNTKEKYKRNHLSYAVNLTLGVCLFLYILFAYHIPKIILGGTDAIIGIIGLALLAMFITEAIKDYISEKEITVMERPASFFKMIKEAIIAFKDKNCPRITWIE